MQSNMTTVFMTNYKDNDKLRTGFIRVNTAQHVGYLEMKNIIFLIRSLRKNCEFFREVDFLCAMSLAFLAGSVISCSGLRHADHKQSIYTLFYLKHEGRMILYLKGRR